MTTPNQFFIRKLNQDRESYMTIIVGIVCKDGLVVTADSQAESWRGVAVKRLDYHKITVFPQTGDLYVIVSGAGIGTFISKATDKLKTKYESTKISTAEKLSDEAEEVMTDMQKRYVVEKMDKLGIGGVLHDHKRLRKTQADFEMPNFILMVGCITKEGENPTIYTIGRDGVSERAEKFASTGSGSAYAEYLLTKMYRDDIMVEQAKKLGVLIIEEVKRIDPGCGGPTQVVVLTKKGIIKLNPEQIKEIAEEVFQIDGCASKTWWAVVNGEKTCDEVNKYFSKRT